MPLKIMIINLILLGVFLLPPVVSQASNQIPAPSQDRPVALVGGAIHPVSEPAIERGSILFDKGRIVALGRDIKIPSDATVVDVKGKHVYPGLIECISNLGLVEINAIRGTSDYMEIGNINPNVRAERAINPGSERIPVTRANGVALAVVLPRGGLISGQAALVALDGWTWEDMTLKAPLSMVVSCWPDLREGRRKVGEERRKEIKEGFEEIEEAFRKTRAYKTAREAAEAGGQGPFHARNERWEAMMPVLRGEVPIWVMTNRLQEIEASVDWAEREGLRMVLVGGGDALFAASLLKRKGIPVIVTPVLRGPLRRHSDYDEQYTLPSRLAAAGIEYCIGGNSSVGRERNLPYHAAMAAAFGLPREEALKAITLYAARILGVADRVGSLETGKDATLIVTDGDPLEITTQVEKLYIQGREVDLDNKQKALYRKYREKYRQLGMK
jgi:imidazolonepropionase-like amidohydrolase